MVLQTLPQWSTLKVRVNLNQAQQFSDQDSENYPDPGETDASEHTGDESDHLLDSENCVSAAEDIVWTKFGCLWYLWKVSHNNEMPDHI